MVYSGPQFQQYTDDTRNEYLAQFRKLPVGYINSTDRFIISTGYLDEPDGTLIEQGIGLIHTGTIGDVPRVQIPSATNITTGKFYGILVYDHAHYRYVGQPQFTYQAKELVPVCREVMNVRLYADTPVTFGQDLFLIHTAATGQKPGHFKSSASANAIAIKGRWVENLTQPGVASAEIFHSQP